MTRRSKILLALLIPALAFTAWTWTRPYAWNPDSAARAEIQFARLTRDHSYHWLDLTLKITRPDGHNLEQPVKLITGSGRHIDPADTTLSGRPGQPIENIALRFWLEPGDLDGPLTLKLNDGTLEVRSRSDAPSLDDGASKVFHTSRW